MNPEQILMPRISPNDDTVTLAEWLVREGDRVDQGQEIATLETTKKVTGLRAPADGYIHLAVEAGEEYGVGVLLASLDEMQGQINAGERSDMRKENASLQMTHKAQLLIEQYHIDTQLLPKNRLIREKDILSLVSKPYSIQEINGNKLLIYGTGGFAREAISVIRQTYAYRPVCIISGIGEMNREKSVLGVEVVSGKELDRLLEEGCTKAVNAMAVAPNAFSRKNIYESLKKKGLDFPNLIDRSAVISTDVTMGEGNLILAGAFLGSCTTIGSDCIINVHAAISHQCIVSDHCHIATGAVLAGGVTIGENTLIGQGCTIYQDVKIGKNVVIHNGCRVFKDVPDGSVVKS